tara:strand:+ start:444 stop:842 length:399 start_codon:yes stop_codon:yes gene_type:complete
MSSNFYYIFFHNLIYIFPLLAPYKSIPIVNRLAIITGRGAVGFSVIKKIKSGSAKNPIITKKRNDNRLSALRSLIDKEPKIRNTIPITIKLMTKAKVSNICTVSELKFDPKVSAIKKVLKSAENIDITRGVI